MFLVNVKNIEIMLLYTFGLYYSTGTGIGVYPFAQVVEFVSHEFNERHSRLCQSS